MGRHPTRLEQSFSIFGGLTRKRECFWGCFPCLLAWRRTKDSIATKNANCQKKVLTRPSWQLVAIFPQNGGRTTAARLQRHCRRIPEITLFPKPLRIRFLVIGKIRQPRLVRLGAMKTKFIQTQSAGFLWKRRASVCGFGLPSRSARFTTLLFHFERVGTLLLGQEPIPTGGPWRFCIRADEPS